MKSAKTRATGALAAAASAADAVVSPVSQLAAMTGVDVAASKAVALPVTLVGQFVRGDVKKGDAAHAFRLSMVRTAVLESLKNNPRSWAELSAESAGKTSLCVAYQAGINAVAAMTRQVQAGELGHKAAILAKGAAGTERKELYALGESVALLMPFAKLGKWGIAGTAGGESYDNAPLAAYADTLADAAQTAFANAWAASIEAGKADRAAAKAKKEADAKAAQVVLERAKADAQAATARAAETAQEEADAQATTPVDDITAAAVDAHLLRASAVETTVEAIRHGLLSPSEIQALFSAMEDAGIEFVTAAPAEEIAA